MGLHVALDQLILDDGGVVVALGSFLLGRIVTPTGAFAVAVAGTICRVIDRAVPFCKLPV